MDTHCSAGSAAATIPDALRLKDYRVLDDRRLSCLYPGIEVGRRGAFWLDEYHLSVFREHTTDPKANK